jgi:glycosyltransferase involved in cell wall biosynthesis
MRVGILASHPIQYQAPWFRALSKHVDLDVFFANRPDPAQQGRGFGKPFTWDVDLLSGYRHLFLENRSANPSVNHFFGCDTPGIREIIATKRFDAFIVTGWSLKSYWQAIRACRRHGVVILVRGDSQLQTPRSFPSRAWKQWTHRLALRQFDGFLSVGRRNREYLLHYGVAEEKIFFVPHFVDNERFAQQANEIRKSKLEIRKQWNIPEDAFCVLFCGKFIPKKRPMDLVKAAQRLVKDSAVRDRRYSSVHLLLAGSGELGGELRANCNVVFDAENANSSPLTHDSLATPKHREGGSLPNASFAGFLNQTEIARAYVAADVLVLPSDGRETWGLVVNEAMACGLPAIVSDTAGCAPDLIEEGKTGFRFSVGDFDQLAARLETIEGLKQPRTDFGPALASKLQDYSIERAVAGTMEAIEATVTKR